MALTDDFPPVRILLVDDNPANLLALGAVLEPLKQELVRASSGAQALALLGEQDFALVLMDVAMPILDGFETVARIRRNERIRHQPVMFITALFRDEAAAARGYSLGAVDFIIKPFEPDIIRAKVGAFVTLYQHNEEIKRQQRRIIEEAAARKAAELASAILSHDLRSPLNAIMLTAQKHGRTEALEECRKTGARIANSAQRMNRLLADVQDYARSRLGGVLRLTRRPADLAQLCRATIDEQSIIHPHCNIVLHVEGDVRGEWDEDRIIRVCTNLVDNAIKHTNGAQGEIEVSVQSAGDDVVLEVHNFGAPIPPSTMRHLFEPFQRGEHEREGLGLGLYIVDQVVRAHGGTTSARSSEDEGTTFTVRLPRQLHPAHQTL